LPSVKNKILDKDSLPNVKKTLGKNSLPSAKNKTLGKEFLCRVFFFSDGFLLGTWQRASLPSARKKHSVNYLTLGKEPNSGSDSKLWRFLTTGIALQISQDRD
jgi:hypothetical protein